MRKQIIPLSNIISNSNRNDFSSDMLANAAAVIFNTGALLHPLFLRMTKFEGKYELICKDFAFHAALVASENDPAFNQVEAYVVESEEDEMMCLVQWDIDSYDEDMDGDTDDDFDEEIDGHELELKEFSALLEELKQLNPNQEHDAVSKADFEGLKNELSVHIFSLMQAIEQNGSQFNSLFEVLGEIDHQVEQTLTKLSTLDNAPRTHPLDDLLQAINQQPLDILAQKLRTAGANKVFVDGIIKARSADNFIPIDSLEQLLEVKGVGDRSLLKVLSLWGR